jgi:hypothetical protein
MAVRVWTELVCRRCASNSEGLFTKGGIRRGQLKGLAKGWGFQNDQAYCPECWMKDNQDG